MSRARCRERQGWSTKDGSGTCDATSLGLRFVTPTSNDVRGRDRQLFFVPPAAVGGHPRPAAHRRRHRTPTLERAASFLRAGATLGQRGTDWDDALHTIVPPPAQLKSAAAASDDRVKMPTDGGGGIHYNATVGAEPSPVDLTEAGVRLAASTPLTCE